MTRRGAGLSQKVARRALPSTPWPTISPGCSIMPASTARSRSPASPSAAPSRCISPPATPRAPAPSPSAAPPRRSRRIAAPRCWNASPSIEANGMGVRRRGLDAERLCPTSCAATASASRNIARAGSATIPPATPPSIACWRATDMQHEMTHLRCPVLVIGGAVRSRASAGASRRPWRTRFPGARYTELRTGHYMAAQTPDLLVRLHRRFSQVGRRVTRSPILPKGFPHDFATRPADPRHLSSQDRRHRRHRHQRRLSRRQSRRDAQCRSRQGAPGAAGRVPPGAPHQRQRLPDPLQGPHRDRRHRLRQLPAADRRLGAAQPRARRHRCRSRSTPCCSPTCIPIIPRG